MVFLQYENQKLLLTQHNELMTPPPDAPWVHLMPHRCVLAATGVWEIIVEHHGHEKKRNEKIKLNISHQSKISEPVVEGGHWLE